MFMLGFLLDGGSRRDLGRPWTLEETTLGTEGAQLFLTTLAHGIKVGMREHADLVIDRYPF